MRRQIFVKDITISFVSLLNKKGKADKINEFNVNTVKCAYKEHSSNRN